MFVTVFSISDTFADSCGSKGIALQVPGSGGLELQDKRASIGNEAVRGPILVLGA